MSKPKLPPVRSKEFLELLVKNKGVCPRGEDMCKICYLSKSISPKRKTCAYTDWHDRYDAADDKLEELAKLE